MVSNYVRSEYNPDGELCKCPELLVDEPSKPPDSPRVVFLGGDFCMSSLIAPNTWNPIPDAETRI